MTTVTQNGKEGTQHRKARLREILNKKWKGKQCEGNILEVQRIAYVVMAVSGRSGSRNDVNTRSGVTHKVSCNKNITRRSRKQTPIMSKV
jgi:hypothetical protein